MVKAPSRRAAGNGQRIAKEWHDAVVLVIRPAASGRCRAGTGGSRPRIPRVRTAATGDLLLGGRTIRSGAAVVAAIAGSAALLLAACAGQPARPGAALAAAGQTASPEPGLQRFYDQTLDWTACPQQWAVDTGAAQAGPQAAQAVAGYQCAWLTVPLNYSDPGGPTIRLAMNRLPAADPSQRIGPLLTNPGGPGASGVAFGFRARQFFTARLRARYDIVGMDPRGVELSNPVNCMLSAVQQEVSSALAYATAQAQACQRNAGSLIPYVGTDNAARDLDIARAALGEPKLDYYGVSYGTLLGLTYANLFPHNVGNMVLDSVDSPEAEDNPVTQATGFETTFTYMIESCVARGSCPMGPTASAAAASFTGLLSRLAAAPVPDGPDGQPLTASTLLSWVSQSLYAEKRWPALWATLGALISGQPGAAASVQLRNPLLLEEGFEAIYCLTIPQAQRTVAAAQQAGIQAKAAAPIFGSDVGSGRLNCALWPVPSPPDAGQPIHAAGAPPILLVSNLYDPATPVSWAEQVHADVPNSLLVTNVAGGHGFYPLGSCTQNVVDSFLISAAKPAPGTTCHDRDPEVATPGSNPVPVTG
jgi:pimeloyl-ACP methyl ester carboxylesterase